MYWNSCQKSYKSLLHEVEWHLLHEHSSASKARETWSNMTINEECCECKTKSVASVRWMSVTACPHQSPQTWRSIWRRAGLAASCCWNQLLLLTLPPSPSLPGAQQDQRQARLALSVYVTATQKRPRHAAALDSLRSGTRDPTYRAWRTLFSRHAVHHPAWWKWGEN